MRRLFSIEQTAEDARKTVNFLLDNGQSAYRQGTHVYVDDGGIDGICPATDYNATEDYYGD